MSLILKKNHSACIVFLPKTTKAYTMINSIIDSFYSFRNQLFDFFKYRSDSTIDLVDAIAGQVSKESPVKLCLSSLFRRTYSSITDVVDNLFRRKPNVNPDPKEVLEDQLKITNLFAEECPKQNLRPFILFAVDCSSNPRIYSDKLEDRSFVHQPTKVPGQKPITVGHQYSTLVYLPEKHLSTELHWVIPLSVRRVKSNESGTLIGMEQIIQVVTETKFKDQLCVTVNDSAYSNVKCLKKTNELDNLVCISRMRNNRIFHLRPEEEPKRRGRPKIYGNRWVLSNPGEPCESIFVKHRTARGRQLQLRIERWNDRIDRGTTEDGKTNVMIFDAVRVTVLKLDGTPLYKNPLWVMVTGKRRQEIGLEDIAKSYFQRYDIEHFFRFGKQKLLLTSFKTPDVRHEENWWWLCMMSYMMLYKSRFLADHIRHPWEKKQNEVKNDQERTPSQVQRDYERIIGEIGTPACYPKPRGNSPGRAKGSKIIGRKHNPIIKKTEISPKNKEKTAA
jgi:IS4 transposase